MSIADSILETIRRSGNPSIALGGASWLVWPAERRSGASAAMSSAQFVHMGAPVIAVQRNGRMEYFDSEGHLGWTSNLAWPRVNLEMMRLPARAGFSAGPSSAEPTSAEPSSEEDSSDENASR